MWRLRFRSKDDFEALVGAATLALPAMLAVWCGILQIPAMVWNRLLWRFLGTALGAEIIRSECVNCFVSPWLFFAAMGAVYVPILSRHCDWRDIGRWVYRHRFVFVFAIAWNWFIAAELFGTQELWHGWSRMTIRMRLGIAALNFVWCVAGALLIGLLLLPWRLGTSLSRPLLAAAMVEWLLWNYLLASLIYMLPSFGVMAVE